MQRWTASGQTAREFGERHHIDPKQLTWWRWKLHGRSGEAPQHGTRRASKASDRAATSEPVRFLPVRVVPGQERAQGTCAAGPVEVLMHNGLVVRVPEGCAARWAAGLIRELCDSEARSC